jgi:hypothetical protein
LTDSSLEKVDEQITCPSPINLAEDLMKLEEDLMKATTKFLIISITCLILAVPVLAGGWAVVTLETLPGEIRAGEPVPFAFVVRQHGERPVHFLGGDLPVTPYLRAWNPATGEEIRVEAQRSKEVGRFQVEVTFPDSGTWHWEIVPQPFASQGRYPPVEVLPAAANRADSLNSPSNTAEAGVSAVAGWRRWLRALAAVLVIGAVVVALQERHSRRMPSRRMPSGRGEWSKS